MKSTSEKKGMGPLILQLLSLWVACMLMIILYSEWVDTQPPFWNDGDYWRNFAFKHLGYTGIATLGAIDALLFFSIWRAGVAIYRRIAR
jgi:hypothetical protein